MALNLCAIENFYVLIVDDGSDSQARPIFDDLAKIENCEVKRHEVNKGKGAALKTALNVALKNRDFECFITADADGQHEIDDIVHLAKNLALTNLDQQVAVLGVRDFQSPEVPWKSKLGNRVTATLVKFLFGRKVSDTQTGLRGFSRQTTEEIILEHGEKYEYELNCLISMIRNGISIIEIPIKTIYLGIDNPTTHFKPIRDSVRIYSSLFLNFLRFSGVSLFSAGIDVLSYVAFVTIAFDGRPKATEIFISVVCARLISSFVNVIGNKRFVFYNKVKTKGYIVKYYLLVLLIMFLSAIGTLFLSGVLVGHVIWAKIITDTTLFILSYSLQGLWVFQEKTTK